MKRFSIILCAVVLLGGIGGTLGKLAAVDGHVTWGGTDPVVSACGTSPSIVGGGSAGRVTVGGGGATTSCTLTFTLAFALAPACTVDGDNTAVDYRSTTTTTTMVITSSADMQSDIINYICIGL